MELTGGEGAHGGEVGEAHHGLHHGELARMIELEAGNAFAVRYDRRGGQLA